jgi:hypothetical protein
VAEVVSQVWCFYRNFVPIVRDAEAGHERHPLGFGRPRIAAPCDMQAVEEKVPAALLELDLRAVLLLCRAASFTPVHAAPLRIRGRVSSLLLNETAN